MITNTFEIAGERKTVDGWFRPVVDGDRDEAPVVGSNRFTFIDYGMSAGNRVTVAIEPIGQEL